jgi:ribose transport system permease protein
MFGRLETRALVLLAIVWIAFGISTTGFFADATFTSIFGRSVDNGLIAVGFTVCLLSGQIDLSVGALYALAGVVFATVEPGYGIAIGFLTACTVGLVVGLFNGLLIGRYRVDSFTATLGTLLVCRGAAFAVSDGRPVNASNLDASLWFNRTLFGPISPRVIVLVAFVVVVHVFVTRTRQGRELVAVGGDPDAARAAGIPVGVRITQACVVSSLGASLAGAVAALSLLSGSPIVGDAALTGGVGSVVATAVALVVLSSIATGMELSSIEKAWQSVVTGLVIIVGSAVVLREQIFRLWRDLRQRLTSDVTQPGGATP